MVTKLLIVSHALIQESSQARWRKLAEKGEFNIRILVPKKWESNWFGEKKTTLVHHADDTQQANFQVVPVSATSRHDWRTYLLGGVHVQLKQFAPDVIYCIHEEKILALQQAIVYRRIFAPMAKLIYFSMDAFERFPRLTSSRTKTIFHWLYRIISWINVRNGTDGAICHYPGIERQIRNGGYNKPILVQTQIGVDPDLFKADIVARKQVRRLLGLSGFVVGYVGRLTKDKGVLDLIAALDRLDGDWQLLLVGDGDARPRVEAWIAQNGYKERVKITGYVNQSEVVEFMNAMDCFCIGSHTTEKWIDTFPLVVAQAMAMKIPVIGSNSGGIPFQLGEAGLLFEEGNIAQLTGHLNTLKNDSKLRQRIGQKLYRRARDMFLIETLNDQFTQYLNEKILH